MKVNRVFCIGRNYADHISELGNSPDSACLIFMKPASAVVPVGEPIRLPRDRGDTHHEAELVVMLTGGGSDIPVEHALENVAAITLGLDLTLRDLQAELKKKGAPWEIAKSFDGAAPLGDWQPFLDHDLQALEFTLTINGELRQHGRTQEMLYTVARQIHILSQTWALQPGDIIFTGTPKGVAALKPGDHAVLEGAGLGHHEWTCV